MIRIVILEDQESLLGVIGSLLNLEEDMEVASQASNGEEALTLVHCLKPDICIMDVEMPGKNGLEVAEALMSAGCKVIILTTFARAGYWQRALKAGVTGYLLKDSPSEELVGSIRSIMRGERIYAPELKDEPDTRLETEESNCLDGSPNTDTSNQPSNKKGTVRNYFSAIIEKMKLNAG
ncbi:response regulator transcription factor [Neobacillus sp. 114]|uniref:response regulator n=1 Tax=Neobacillus sp. 114 TaxID=3048535 RepID=UPI0024C31E89|nr:response regulator transcription factor [Neobacillus sp. 114]